MSEQVFLIDLRTTVEKNMDRKITGLLKAAGMQEVINPSDLVAVKLHFGEQGNTAFIRPIFIRSIVEAIVACEGKPFLTDTNTLYRGERDQAVNHIMTALTHGFNTTTVPAPVIIADGLRGIDDVKVPVEGKHFSEVSIASTILQADSLICVSHFKGHELTGFGGALKNLGMGCASREGKMKQHCTISPDVDQDICTGCGKCISWCPADAITLAEGTSAISKDTCIGCAECITVCPVQAVKINWDESTSEFQEKLAEYAGGVAKSMQDKCFYITFLNNISPACDCYGHADHPIVADIGILASRDPVAIDQAAADLVNRQPGFSGSALTCNHSEGQDKFRGIYPEVNWEIQLEYAQTYGIGTRSYTLVSC